MSRFENIVRPFQLPNVTYPTRIFDPSRAVVDEEIVKTFGEDGQAKVFQCSLSQNITTYKDEEIKEKERDTSEKRIENPDDESQYVMVELINTLTTEKGRGSKWQKTKYTFENE